MDPPSRFHGVLLNWLSTGVTSPFLLLPSYFWFIRLLLALVCLLLLFLFKVCLYSNVCLFLVSCFTYLLACSLFVSAF
jgi:hypothetical protein